MADVVALLLLFQLLGVCDLFVVASLNPVDYDALKSVRSGLRDKLDSKFFISWKFNSDPCNFSGVYCNADRVVSLQLGEDKPNSPGLSGYIHPAIGNLSALVSLTLSDGSVAGSLPASLGNLKNLSMLGVRRNLISGSIPPELGQLQLLRILDLCCNKLNGSIPTSVGKLMSLTHVVLHHNRLSGSVPSFSSPKLSHLQLQNNELSGSIWPIALPSSLLYLSLSDNRLSGPLYDVLSNLTNLEYLDLSMNNLSGCIDGGMFKVPMNKLALQRNSFTCMIMKQPVEVKIKIVDLSFNKFSGEISSAFSLVNKLYLNNNHFNGTVPDTLVFELLAEKITILYLQHNYLTGINISPSAQLNSSSLCINYNCMTPPSQSVCPHSSGRQRRRPASQCALASHSSNPKP